jgi:hypothetical protein
MFALAGWTELDGNKIADTQFTVGQLNDDTGSYQSIWTPDTFTGISSSSSGNNLIYTTPNLNLASLFTVGNGLFQV